MSTPTPKRRRRMTNTSTASTEPEGSPAKTPSKSRPAYNRELTDALCTAADLQETRDWINKQIQGWNSKPPKASALPPYTAMIMTAAGEYQLPPMSVKLSDEHVYMVTKFLSVKQRKQHDWTEDFNNAGEIRADRTPLAPSPLLIAFNVPFIPVFRGYYILAGPQAAKKYGTSSNIKNNATTKAAGTDWLVGPVIASQAFVNEPRNLIRIYHDTAGERVTTKLGDLTFTGLMPSEKDQPATPSRHDRVARGHFDFSLWHNGTALRFISIADHPDYYASSKPRPVSTPAPSQAPAHAQPDPVKDALLEQALVEADPTLRNIFDEVHQAQRTFPEAVDTSHYPTLIGNLQLFRKARAEIEKLDSHYAACLQAWTDISAKVEGLRPAAKQFMLDRLQPLKDHLKTLAVLKQTCQGPAGIPSHLLPSPDIPQRPPSRSPTPTPIAIDFAYTEYDGPVPDPVDQTPESTPQPQASTPLPEPTVQAQPTEPLPHVSTPTTTRPEPPTPPSACLHSTTPHAYPPAPIQEAPDLLPQAEAIPPPPDCPPPPGSPIPPPPPGSELDNEAREAIRKANEAWAIIQADPES
ncbi:hypothetical protein N7462_003966 [Penicillium macrosclerotiorum]|uniref:uncharacterized protein n=1 Tax=Penicillium macrosclerotiorum TaxID=303699 RepID=UPI002548D0DF|nr:uncharacterized protein N7462_003966 [Penicillium macrosclerotiorum]KAJ5689574.1 hypothetical protein N7462_003966 [Penicillium macrosclerotiorum]